MTASLPWAGEVLCNLIEPHVAMVYFQQKLQGTLKPHMKAPHTGGFDKDGVVQVP